VSSSLPIYIVGLGPGDAERLPTQAYALLTSGLPVLLRTARHPVLTVDPLLTALQRLPVSALDDEYEQNPTFDDTYNAIVARVLRVHAAQGEMVYAVPGHPLLGETTVERLLQTTRKAGIPTRIIGAPSFVDACLEAIGVAVTSNLQVVDALTLHPEEAAPAEVLRTGSPLLLYQVHSREVASQTKLALMHAGYPDDFRVTIIRSAGIPGQETVQEVPLYTLDRDPNHDHLTSVWIPELPVEQRRKSFYDLVRVMARLRDPEGGCPWDLKQTHQTLRKYVLEEAYEVVEAIDRDDPDDLCEELGDLLLQVVFHAQLASEEGLFEADDVCATIVEKLIRRHPHVFGEVKVSGAEQVLTNWEAIKATEKAEKGKETPVSILDGITTSLPALMMALEVSKRAVKVGFEWSDMGGVLDKVEEEFAELRHEIEAGTSREKVAYELGDLLFTLVNVGRKFEIDPELALREQLTRFKRRFHHIEQRSAEASRALESLTLEEMEAFWQEAKSFEKQDKHRETSAVRSEENRQ